VLRANAYGVTELFSRASNQKGQIRKKNSGAIIIKILNKKGLKIKILPSRIGRGNGGCLAWC
jgi:hypothetical protein